MKEILSFIYRFLGEYKNLDYVWKFSSDGGNNGMFWGFVLLVGISLLIAIYYYRIYTRKLANRAILKNWLWFMLISAIAVFVVQELVLSGMFTAAQKVKNVGDYMQNLIVADNGKMILFSFVNALYSVIAYYLWSSLLCRLIGGNARYIPHAKKNRKK